MKIKGWLLIIALIIGFVFLLSQNKQQGARFNVISDIQNGLGSGVTIAQNASQVTTSVNSVDSFLNSRANLTLSTDIQSKLTDYETKVLNGVGSRLTTQQIATLINAQLFETLPNLSNADLADIGQSSQSVPAYGGDFYTLRGSCCNVPVSDWQALAQAYRDNSTQQAVELRAATPDFILSETSNRVSKYHDALGWTSGDLSPVQAYLICYSVISDDFMGKSPSQLSSEMLSVENSLKTKFGINAPSSGLKPFGYNGYLRRSPLNKLFNETFQQGLAAKIKTACGV